MNRDVEWQELEGGTDSLYSIRAPIVNGFFPFSTVEGDKLNRG